LGQLQIDLGKVGPEETNGRFFDLEKRTSRSHVSGCLLIKIGLISGEDASRRKQLENDRGFSVQHPSQKQKDDQKYTRQVEGKPLAKLQVFKFCFTTFIDVKLMQLQQQEHDPHRSKEKLIFIETSPAISIAESIAAPPPLSGSTFRLDDCLSAEQLAAQKLRQLQQM
jgi:hypothetical protein